MNILFISAADKQFDGRTRALLDILNNIGSVFEITATNGKEIYKEKECRINTHGRTGYLRFIKKSISYAKNIRNIDCVFLDNRKSVIPGLKIYKILNPNVIIYDARELYLKEEVSTLASKIGCFYEKKAIAAADVVLCANEERRGIMLEKFKHNGDILVFENFRKLEYSEEVNSEELKIKFSKYFEDESFKIVSTSGCEIERGTEDLVNAVSRLSYKSTLFLVGCKDDEDRVKIEKIAKNNKSIFVEFLPRVNQDELKYFLSFCDVGVAMYHKRNANNLYCSSGKVYEYIYEGLPIAVSDNPPLLNLVNKYKVGASNADIRDALEEVYKKRDFYRANVKKFIECQVVEKGQLDFADKLSNYISSQI